MSALKETLTAFLDGFMAEYGLPGYDCAVWQRGSEIYRHSAGLADVENGIPYSKDTLLHIYSNTKVIACTAALQLWEQGLFSLDDPIAKYFPAMADMQVKLPDGSLVGAARPITIRHLFTMTAGIGDGGDYADMGMQFYMETGGACPIEKLPDFLARTPLKFHPGEGFCYGICHEVLAALIVKLTGESFAGYLKAHIFDPLGMTNTAFDPAQCASQELANQYNVETELKNLGNTNILIPPILTQSASGGLVSTVDDYMKFQQALCAGESLLKRDTIDLMRTNCLTGAAWAGYGYRPGAGGQALGYGLGVRTVYDPADPTAKGAFGWGGAAGTYGLIDPEKQLVLFYAQQAFGTRDIQGSGELAKLVYQNP